VEEERRMGRRGKGRLVTIPGGKETTGTRGGEGRDNGSPDEVGNERERDGENGKGSN